MTIRLNIYIDKDKAISVEDCDCSAHQIVLDLMTKLIIDSYWSCEIHSRITIIHQRCMWAIECCGWYPNQAKFNWYPFCLPKKLLERKGKTITLHFHHILPSDDVLERLSYPEKPDTSLMSYNTALIIHSFDDYPSSKEKEKEINECVYMHACMTHLSWRRKSGRVTVSGNISCTTTTTTSTSKCKHHHRWHVLFSK